MPLCLDLVYLCGFHLLTQEVLACCQACWQRWMKSNSTIHSGSQSCGQKEKSSTWRDGIISNKGRLLWSSAWRDGSVSNKDWLLWLLVLCILHSTASYITSRLGGYSKFKDVGHDAAYTNSLNFLSIGCVKHLYQFLTVKVYIYIFFLSGKCICALLEKCPGTDIADDVEMFLGTATQSSSC